MIETHFHADFLSGHLELAAATGAEVVFGAAADPEFAARLVADGERIRLGEVGLELRATPGHTPESISIVVWEHPTSDADRGASSPATRSSSVTSAGPTCCPRSGLSADDLAGMLYDSLHRQLLTLPDATKVYPAHGAGSSCGKNLSTATVSTIGEQRRRTTRSSRWPWTFVALSPRASRPRPTTSATSGPEPPAPTRSSTRAHRRR